MSLSYNDIVKWWRMQELNTVDDYRTVLENFQIVFASNTNGIEGADVNYHTTRAVFENGNISSYSGPVDNLFLVRNQKFAFEFIIRGLLGNVELTSSFIKKLHYILMYGSYDDTRWNKGERPGSYKVHDYCVGLQDVGSEPEDVADDIESLLDELESTDITDVLMSSAYFHSVFESIHPFADGNGRVGRTLLNYFLMQHNYPPLVIYEEDKETYYMALEVFNRTEKLSGMKKFLEEQTIKTWKNHVNPDTVKLKWCRLNAPDAAKDLSDTEILKLMGSSYDKFS